MNIGFDARGAILYKGTGIGTYTQNLLDNMTKIDKKNNYTLFLADNLYPSRYKNKRFKLYISGKTNKSFWDNSYVPSKLSENNLDLFHLPQNGIGMPKEDCTKYVVTVHDLIPFILPETVGASYCQKFVEQMPYILQNSAHIITVSEYSKQDILRLFNIPSTKVTAITSGANKIYKPLSKTLVKNYLNKKYNITNPYILYLGGFSDRKNVSTLLEAFSQLNFNSHPEINLVIVGQDKANIEKLKSLAEKLNIQNRTIFTGYVIEEDLPYFYNGASIFIYPSLYEGFGLPVLESISCGTPTITSNTTSIPEVAGDGAVTIDPTSSSKLKESISDLLENDSFRNNLIKKAIIQSQKFSWKNSAIQTLKVYQDLL